MDQSLKRKSREKKKLSAGARKWGRERRKNNEGEGGRADLKTYIEQNPY